MMQCTELLETVKMSAYYYLLFSFLCVSASNEQKTDNGVTKEKFVSNWTSTTRTVETVSNINLASNKSEIQEKVQAIEEYLLENLPRLRFMMDYRYEGDAITNSFNKSQFAEMILIQHNKYRHNHGVPILQLDPLISNVSQEWADILAKSGYLYHRPNSQYGENLYKIWSSKANYKMPPNLPVDEWYREIKDYQYLRENDANVTGHFTQLVWQNSKYLGVGVTISAYGAYYVVCNYSPAGNYIGQYQNNVPPPFEWKKYLPKAHFRELALYLHNKYRVYHQASPLSLSFNFNLFADDTAAEMAKNDKLQPKSNSLSMNIFKSNKKNPLAAITEACYEWYNENSKYNYDNLQSDPETDEFTQMIWQSTTQLGIGYAQSHTGQIYVVAYYFPDGNIYGAFKNNVQPPAFENTTTKTIST